MRAVILVLVLVLAPAAVAHAQGTGEWVRADGSAVYLPCPVPREYGARTRLPASCRAARPGILYTVERDAQAEADAQHVVALTAEAEQLRRAAEAGRDREGRLRVSLADLADEHEALGEQNRVALLAIRDAEAARAAAEVRGRAFNWGDAAIGAGVGAVVAVVASAIVVVVATAER